MITRVATCYVEVAFIFLAYRVELMRPVHISFFDALEEVVWTREVSTDLKARLAKITVMFLITTGQIQAVAHLDHSTYIEESST